VLLININITSMLKIGYNISNNHRGSKGHHEKPDRVSYCVEKLKKVLSSDMFIEESSLSTVTKQTVLKMILDVHDKSHITNLIGLNIKKYTCRECEKTNEINSTRLLQFTETVCQNLKCGSINNINNVYCFLDADTYYTYFTFEIILDGIRVIKLLLDEIKNGQNVDGVKYGFALIRPPGHHCENKGSGFCIINNAMVASKYAQQIGYQKIFILDIDYHHGDGTQNLIKKMGTNDIYFCSIHGHGYMVYPGTGSRSDNTEHILNIPLEINVYDRKSRKYIDDEFYTGIVKTEVHDFIQRVGPDMIIVSCGFDGHQDDTLEGFNLTDDAYQNIAGQLKTYGVPVLFVLEGGYSKYAISRSVSKMIYEMTN
jgi:acetoin utilization deacetylase AcuC-like enzyme